MFGIYRSSSLVSAAKPIAAAAVANGRRAFQKTSQQLKASAENVVRGGSKAPEVPPAAADTSSMGKILSFPKDHPFAFQLMVATGKTAAADLMVQTVAEGKSLSEVDWKRNGIFVIFGAFYLGGFQYWIMVNKYRQWFPTMDKFAKMPFAEKLKYPAGILDAGKMVLFDIFVHLPLMYFPTYYSVKEFVGGQTWNPVDWVRDGLTKYSKNYKEDLLAMAQLWGPSDCVQFILPVHMRMPFRHIVSFFWTMYVSFTRGAIQKVEIPQEMVEPIAQATTPSNTSQ